MKILIACALFVVSTIAEPPVDNRYLPPGQGSFEAPSQTYGVPGLGGGAGRHTTAVFGGRQSNFASRGTSRRPSSQYVAPSTQYGAPSGNFGGAPSTQYGAPSAFSAAPSAQYGAPSQFGGASGQLGGAPSSQYGVPSTQYGAPGAQARQPSSQYGVPSRGLSRGFSSHSSRVQAPGVEYGVPSVSTPSEQYVASGFGSVGGGQGPSGYSSGAESRQYLPPGSGRGGYGGDDGSSEPANYSFEYMVKDEPSGNDFGHRESRQGDVAEGLYYVLLPDGRKQTVQYQAGQGGYKPRISYEDIGTGIYGNQGYQEQGPY